MQILAIRATGTRRAEALIAMRMHRTRALILTGAGVAHVCICNRKLHRKEVNIVFSLIRQSLHNVL